MVNKGSNFGEGVNTITSGVSTSGTANVTAHFFSHLVPLLPNPYCGELDEGGMLPGREHKCQHPFPSDSATPFSVVKYVSITSTADYTVVSLGPQYCTSSLMCVRALRITGLSNNLIARAGLTSDSYAGQVFWKGASREQYPVCAATVLGSNTE